MQRSLKPNTLLAILTGLNLLNYIDRFILASLIESVSKEFSLSDVEAGSLATAFIFGYFLTSPFFGYLGDRMQKKWLIAGGIFVWSLATFLTGWATSYTQLILLRILVGLGEASYATLSPALLADAFSAEKRNKALTIFYSAIPLGAAIGTLGGSWIGETFGWHYAFIWAGLPGFLLAFVLLPFKEAVPRRDDGLEETIKPSLKDFAGLLKNKKFNLVVWGYVAYTFALGAYQYWSQTFLQRQHAMGHTSAGTFFGGVMVITGLVGTFAGGAIASRAQARSPCGYAKTIGLSVLFAVPLCFIFTLNNSLLLSQCSITIAMLLLFVPTGPVNTVILESVPSNLRASAMALSIFAIHAFGDLWSPMLVGKLSDHFNSLRHGLVVLPPALLICAALWLLLAKHTDVPTDKDL